MNPYILIPNVSLTAYFSGRPYCLAADHSNFAAALEAIKSNNEKSLEAAFTPLLSAKRVLPGLELRGDQVFLDGEEIHGTIVKRILEFVRGGFPVDHLRNFLVRLKNNPSNRSVSQLYGFLELYKLPILEDGCFLAHKAVDKNLFDKHSRTVFYGLGSKHAMPRNEISDDPADTCNSRGFYIGSYEYVKRFGSSDGDRFILVKVDPADVVCVPNDSSWQKVRVCRLEVVSEVPRPEFQDFQSNSVRGETNLFPHEAEDEDAWKETDEWAGKDEEDCVVPMSPCDCAVCRRERENTPF